MFNVIPKLQNCHLTGSKVNLLDFRSIHLPEKWSAVIPLAEDVLFFKYKATGDKRIDVIEDTQLAKEGYRLILTETAILIAAATVAGVLYALETLRVAAKLDAKTPDYLLSTAEITDSPRFEWRGIELDESRHFFGKAAVKRLLDLLAMHKCNRFHWHLTDDQGWRIEIKKYPRLTEIGAFRSKSNIHGWSSADHDSTPHGGFYTAEDVKEIVAYATDRNIQIIPEIDMPAHFQAAFAAYPHLACRNVPAEVHWFFGGKHPRDIGWEDWNRSACVGKPETMQFIKDVIDEIVELFPAPYFHIGGDEAPKDEWKKCPDCQKMIKEKGLANEDSLQGFFTNEVNEYVKAKGKQLIGWNEVLHGGNLDNSVIVQYWTPGKDKRVAKHLKDGGKIVMSNHKCFYFDMCYAMYPLRNTYGYKPNMAGVSKKQIAQVFGVEGEVWTEWIPDMNKVEFQLFPRLEALAEVGWTSGKKNYKDFVSRLNNFLPILDGMGINYAEMSIADPQSAKYRAKVTHLWHKGCNQDWEITENDKLKQAKK